MGALITLATAGAQLGPSGFQIADTIRSLGSIGDVNKAFNSNIPRVKTDRGAQLPCIVGRAKVGPVFMGELTTRVVNEPNSVSGGKGGLGAAGGIDNEVTYARGMFAVCVGPARRLRSIEANGEVIWPIGDQFSSGISQTSNPSGSRLALGGEPSKGSMVIYWGERDQPVDVSATAFGRFPVATNFPHVCWIYFDEYRLGSGETWPSIIVDIEVAPFKPGNLFGTNYLTLPSALGVSEAWFRNGRKIDETKCGDALIYDDAAGTIKVAGNLTPLDQYVIRYSSSLLTVGNAQAATYNAGETIDIPQTQGLTRLVRNDWENMFTIGNVSFTSVTGEFIPGVQGNATQLAVYRFQTTLAGSWAGVLPPLAGGPTPPGGTNHLHAGTNFNLCQFYLSVDGVSASTQEIDLYFAKDSAALALIQLGPRCKIRINSTAVSVVPETGNGITASAREIGNDWWEVKVWCQTGAGNIIREDENFFVAFEGNQDDFHNVKVAAGTGTSPLAPAMLTYLDRTRYTGITTITTDLDLALFEDFTGEVCPYVLDPNGGDHGANAAHIIYQLLFEEAPHGLGLDKAFFDIASLQAVGVLLESEGLRTHCNVQDFAEVSSALSELMLDVGIELGFDVTTGRYRFDLRRDTGFFAKIPRDMLVEAPVALTRRLEASSAEKVSFSFDVAADRYSKRTIGHSASGDTQNGGFVGASPDFIASALDLEAGQEMARLRASIELSKPNLVQLKLTRDAITLRNTDVIDLEPVTGIEGRFRVLSTQGTPGSSEVQVNAYAETTKLPSAPFAATSLQRDSGDDSDLLDDTATIPLETAEGLLVLRLQGDPRATVGLVQGSNDGTGYWTVGKANTVAGGAVQVIDGTGIYFRTNDNERTARLLTVPTTASPSAILKGVLDDGTMFAFEELEDLGDGLWRVVNTTGTLPGSASWVFLYRTGEVSYITKEIPTEPARTYKVIPVSRRKIGNIATAPADVPVIP